MMEMHIKAVHAVGDSATIKLERWVYGSDSLTNLQAGGWKRGDTSSVCVHVCIVCMLVSACVWGCVGWIRTPSSKCTLDIYVMDTVHKYAVECIERTCTPHSMG